MPAKQQVATPFAAMPDSGAQRLFLALWPEEAQQARMAAILPAAGLERAGRRIALENLHLTLAFLGSVAGANRKCVEEAAAAVRGEKFTLVLDRLGYWKKPEILWLGSSQTPPALLGLLASLNGGLEGCGYRPEERAFHVHITLARRVRRASRLPDIEPIEWPVERFNLVESRTLPSGAKYGTVASWDLL